LLIIDRSYCRGAETEPMKIGMQTWGAEGDVRPFLAPALMFSLLSETSYCFIHSHDL